MTHTVLSQTPLRPHRAPESQGTAGNKTAKIAIRFIETSNMINRTAQKDAREIARGLPQ